MKFLTIILASLIGNQLFASNCQYTVKDKSLTWTGYKFSEKSPVSGTFNTMAINTLESASSIELLIKSANVWIDTESFESKDSMRNRNIVKNLFKKISGGRTLTVHVKNVDLDKKKATAHLAWAQEHYPVVLDYNEQNNTLELTSKIDLLELGFKGPFEALKKACKAYHKGKDGKVVTWSEVMIKVTVQLEKKCN